MFISFCNRTFFNYHCFDKFWKYWRS